MDFVNFCIKRFQGVSVRHLILQEIVRQIFDRCMLINTVLHTLCSNDRASLISK